jgi:hypothetical protein
MSAERLEASLTLRKKGWRTAEYYEKVAGG